MSHLRNRVNPNHNRQEGRARMTRAASTRLATTFSCKIATLLKSMFQVLGQVPERTLQERKNGRINEFKIDIISRAGEEHKHSSARKVTQLYQIY